MRIFLNGDAVVMSLHISDVQKFGFHVLELALVVGENSQQASQIQPPTFVRWKSLPVWKIEIVLVFVS